MHMNICDVCQKSGVITPARMRKLHFDLRECFGELYPSADEDGVEQSHPAFVQLVVERSRENVDLCDVHALEVVDLVRAVIQQAIDNRNAETVTGLLQEGKEPPLHDTEAQDVGVRGRI